jgi:hypothetical protein
MKMEHWLLILLGAVVVYFLYKAHMMNGSSAQQNLPGVGTHSIPGIGTSVFGIPTRVQLYRARPYYVGH